MMIIMLQCGHDSVSKGGGASETVASVVLSDGILKIMVESEGPFTVTAEVCSDSFSPVDTQFFHVAAVLTDHMPEWVVPPFFDHPVSIVVRNNADSTATFFHFSWEVNPKDPSESKSLARTGAVSGSITENLVDGSVVPANGIGVFIKGTFFKTIADEQGFYRIDGVPEGNYTLDASRGLRRVYNKSNMQVTVDISGDTTVVKDFSVQQE
jgi:hypothetical protein